MPAALLLPTIAQQATTAADAVESAAAPTGGSRSLMVGELRNLFDSMTSIFSRGDALANPEHLLDGLQSLGLVWAVVFITVGLLCLFNGYRWYKFATVTTALLLGLFAGYWLGSQLGAPFVVAGCLGALLFVVAFPLMKYMVAALGGLAGAFLGANLWAGIARTVQKLAHERAAAENATAAAEQMLLNPNDYWVGALIGLIVCGMLAFILWKLSIVVYTSVSGSTLAVIGVLALLLSVDAWQPTIREGLTASYLVVPLLVFVPAAIGLILQETRKDEASH